ncbi:restriction endonuclease [Aquibacillus rhizosphaerae]|uniref:Restriction endonuclease n=1 Tax=Aquibacillus rhizosphaerae TaxID=3051431 RepID=A0ABT7L4Y9_9BACI|nr:restriction endonuclease [Aquibacillus sp. LR5S19]MDL4839665.1 restriction endonuclease [Aquibacillus sp. LR5S19]
MDVLTIGVVVVAIVGVIHLWLVKQRNDYQEIQIAHQINKNDQTKRTLVNGIFFRFNFPKDETDEFKYSDMFIKQTPHEFEAFVAEVLENKYGGDAFVTVGSGDFGIDIEHRREVGLYLAQVKCEKNNLPFDPIAKIHSNMVKRNAVGGYVITTRDFTSAARSYAKDLDIHLIDGESLVEMWLEGLEEKDRELLVRPINS